jgi:hypothetical protein
VVDRQGDAGKVHVVDENQDCNAIGDGGPTPAGSRLDW